MTNNSNLSTYRILDALPPEVKKWAESLPWIQRRYVLSLCHIICAAPADVQAQFLDDYTADGLVAKMLTDVDTLQRVKDHLLGFHLKTELDEHLLRHYIRQFYIHSAQDLRRQPDLYLESALQLILSPEKKNDVFNYILGFELLKMMFQMSWQQLERLSRLQNNQEIFIKSYVKPIQHTHRINGIVVPKDEKIFFAVRSYYIQKPDISTNKLTELVIATFRTNIVVNLGLSITHHTNSVKFDKEYIFNQEQETLFPI